MTFQVGQKVICLRDGSRHDHIDKFVCPVAGREYVIRSLSINDQGDVGLRFHWLCNPVCDFSDGRDEPAFASVGLDGVLNFRPVVETQTDISVFTEILNRVNSKVPAPV